MSGLGIHIRTKFGMEHYGALHVWFKQHKEEQKLNEFREALKKELDVAEGEYLAFLTSDLMQKKHKMDDDDKDGWTYNNEASDRVTNLKYFIQRTITG